MWEKCDVSGLGSGRHLERQKTKARHSLEAELSRVEAPGGVRLQLAFLTLSLGT